MKVGVNLDGLGRIPERVDRRLGSVSEVVLETGS